MEQSVPKRRRIKFRSPGIAQNKEYSVQNTTKIWNQVPEMLTRQVPEMLTRQVPLLSFLVHYSWMILQLHNQ